jgi:hypothetical protein
MPQPERVAEVVPYDFTKRFNVEPGRFVKSIHTHGFGHKIAALFYRSKIIPFVVAYAWEATMPARAKAEGPDTYRSMPYRTKANVVDDEQLNRADILALKMMLPAVLSRVGCLDPILSSAIQEGVQDAIDQVEHMIAAAPRTETREHCTSALASIRRLKPSCP